VRYDAFISYSHAADGKLAPALQRALEKFAKPWYQRRALHIFRDETDLSANPHLWETIVDNLSQAEWFILMASAEAVKSKWVTREIAWWLEQRSSRRILILLTDGEVNWNEEVRDFDWERTTAIPQVLQGKFSDEPLYVDLRSAKSERNLTLRHTAFRSAVLRVAAPIHGLPMDEMDGQAVRTYRKNIASAAILVTALITALAGAIWQWTAATFAEREAVKQAKIAQSRELASRSVLLLENDPQLALHLAVRGVLRWQTTEAKTALRQCLAGAERSTRKPLGHVGHPGDRFIALSVTSKYGVTRRGDTHLEVWQLQPEPRQVLVNTVLVGSPLFSEDETLIATRTSEGALTVWSMEDGQRIARFENVQTAAFAGRKGLAYLRVDSSGKGSLWLWDPRTHEQTGVIVMEPHSVHWATFTPVGALASSYITVDDRNVDTWNSYGTQPSDIHRDRPEARYTDTHGITDAWFSNSGFFVVTTNANGSNVVRTTDAGLLSSLPLRSLRTVVFDKDEGFMVAVPASGQPAVVDPWTGGIIASLPEEPGGIAAAAFGADGRVMVFASPDGSVWQQLCVACQPFERALETAKTALTHPLTLGERELYLHEERSRPCPIGFPKKNCVELAPDFGPPGTVVEVSLVKAGPQIRPTLTDAAGKTWQLPIIEAAPGIYYADIGGAHRVGTLTIPEGAAFGPATITAGGATRTFSVICMWCDLERHK
jgi:hypothetical protein